MRAGERETEREKSERNVTDDLLVREAEILRC